MEEADEEPVRFTAPLSAGRTGSVQASPTGSTCASPRAGDTARARRRAGHRHRVHRHRPALLTHGDQEGG
ncbi:hypothetical protein ACQ4WX_02200 [Streptomyces lasalocidi]